MKEEGNTSRHAQYEGHQLLSLGVHLPLSLMTDPDYVFLHNQDAGRVNLLISQRQDNSEVLLYKWDFMCTAYNVSRKVSLRFFSPV